MNEELQGVLHATENRYIAHPEASVTRVNALSGTEMTLSFGLADKVVEKALSSA